MKKPPGGGLVALRGTAVTVGCVLFSWSAECLLLFASSAASLSSLCPSSGRCIFSTISRRPKTPRMRFEPAMPRPSWQLWRNTEQLTDRTPLSRIGRCRNWRDRWRTLSQRYRQTLPASRPNTHRSMERFMLSSLISTATNGLALSNRKVSKQDFGEPPHAGFRNNWTWRLWNGYKRSWIHPAVGL
jgi:hypothetical protein